MQVQITKRSRYVRTYQTETPYMKTEIAGSILRGRFRVMNLVYDILPLTGLSEARGIRVGILPYMRNH